jgi:ATP/maltotriose-dependent transcriptional regulator MalT
VTGQTNKPAYYAFGPKLTCVLADIFNLPMTIITSPKGYGKQLAVSAYILNTNALSFWIGIPPDSGTKEFLAYFWDTLAFSFAAPGDSAGTGAAVNAVRMFAAAQNGRETVVVIDNFHNLRLSDQAGVFDWLRGIAASFIQRFHIVLLSDCRMPLRAGEYRSEFIREISKPLLRLDEPEIIAFFRYYGISLTACEAGKALLFSEGWLFALSALIIMSLETNRFDDGVVESAALRMVRYIYDSIWNDLRKQEQNFILLMAEWEIFTREQARFACVRSGITRDPDALLNDLLHHHALIDYDAEKDAYRFHGLLRKLAEREKRKSPLKETIFRVSKEMRSGYDTRTVKLNLSSLSEREMEIYALLCEGKTYREIGETLYISVNTVKTIVKTIYRKLGISGRKNLIGQPPEEEGDPRLFQDHPPVHPMVHPTRQTQGDSPVREKAVSLNHPDQEIKF